MYCVQLWGFVSDKDKTMGPAGTGTDLAPFALFLLLNDGLLYCWRWILPVWRLLCEGVGTLVVLGVVRLVGDSV